MGGFFGGGGASVANMVGATSSAAGTAGLVPQPAAGDENKQLLGNGTFVQTSPFASSGRSASLVTFPVINSFLGFNANSFSTSANMIYFTPVLITSTFEFDRIIFRNNSGNSLANSKFGLYTHDRSAGVPKTLLVASANVASISGSTNNEATVTATTLSPDVYWIAFVSANATSTYRGEDFNASFGIVRTLFGFNIGSSLASWAPDFTANLIVMRYAFTYTGTESFPSSLTASSITVLRSEHSIYMAIRKS